MVTEEELNDMSWSEVLEEYQDQNLMHSFEGDSGMAKLNNFCHDIGYVGHQFKYGSPLEHFLSDNPGACEAMMEWVRNQGTDHPDDEWRNNLADMLELSEDDEDEEENDEEG